MIQPRYVVGHQLAEKIRVIGRGREVNDAFDTIHGAGERLAIAKIAQHTLSEAGRRHPIESAHAVTAAIELSNHGLSDATG
jgi:hypothetical protein